MENTRLVVPRYLIALTVIFALAAVVLAAVLAWRELRQVTTPVSKESLRKSYPGYFRSAEEQTIFEAELIRRNTVDRPAANSSTESLNGSCSFQCMKPARRKREASRLLLHGCCQSNISFVTPGFIQNTQGTFRKVVQFPDAMQFFMVDDCQTVRSCTGSVCSDGTVLYTAVVHKRGIATVEEIEHTEVDNFYLKGCCKSINI